MKISDTRSFTESDAKKPFSAYVVLRSCNMRTAKNGSPFLAAELGDNSGTVSVTCFENSQPFDAFADAQVGDAFYIDALADFYQGRFSPRVERARLLSEAEKTERLRDLAAVSPYDPETMRSELTRLVESIRDESLRNTVKYALLETDGLFYTSSAAVKMHHAYAFGLLEHSLKMAKCADALLPIYPFIDRDLVIAGCVLHDIGKTVEYSQGLVADRTRTGLLQGHVVLGYRIVRKAALKNALNDDLRERLEHIILSHQGELEWGAAVKAATPEAVFVAGIDNFDAHMGAVDAVLRQENNAEFMEVPAFKTKLLTTPVVHEASDTDPASSAQ